MSEFKPSSIKTIVHQYQAKADGQWYVSYLHSPDCAVSEESKTEALLTAVGNLEILHERAFAKLSKDFFTKYQAELENIRSRMVSDVLIFGQLLPETKAMQQALLARMEREEK